MRTILPTLAGLFMSGAALANCPDASDMRTGIAFTTSDGVLEIHKETRKGWVQVLAKFPEGESHLMEFYHGMYMLSSVPVVGGVPQLSELEPFASTKTIQEWPAPSPNSVWQNTRPDGGTAQSGPAKSVNFGDCSYAVYDVTVRFADDPAYSETYRYFPGLGTSLLIVTDDGEFEERYTYSGISKVTR